MLWGNAIGIVFCILQSQFGLFKLDPETYYVSMVPVSYEYLAFPPDQCRHLIDFCTDVGRTFLPDNQN